MSVMGYFLVGPLPPVHKILLPPLQLSYMGHNTGVSTD